MMKKILAALAVIFVVFLAYAATQPSEYRVERSATFNAPAKAVFEQVNNLRKWKAWSPWDKLDPNMKETFEGPEAGAGATNRWEGNSEVGKGYMTITESVPHSLIKMKLEFFEPMAGVSDVEFTFKPEGAQTQMTWAMSGKNDFMGKICSVFMNMDKMIGNDFEKGLAGIKAIVEAPAATR